MYAHILENIILCMRRFTSKSGNVYIYTNIYKNTKYKYNTNMLHINQEFHNLPIGKCHNHHDNIDVEDI